MVKYSKRMNKKYLLQLSILISGIIYAQSPISLSNSNMPGSGDTLRYSNAKLSSIGNYTQTGTNFVWNYSTLEPMSQALRAYKSALLTPYAFFFLGFNEYGEKIADTLGAGPVVMTNYYNFYKKQTTPVNAYIADGVGLTFSAIPVPSYYSDKDELYHFPMTYPKYDSTSFKFSTATSTLIPIKYSKTGYRVTVVDGWGSVTTPYGTANCLRLITTQYSQDSIKNNIVPIPFGVANNQRSYQWLTSSSKIPFLEVNGNLIGNNFTLTQVRYRDLARTIVGVKENNAEAEFIMYPNPVKDKLYLSAIKNQLIEIFNIEGKLVYSEITEKGAEGVKMINVSLLGQGIYLVRLSNDANMQCFKFIKE